MRWTPVILAGLLLVVQGDLWLGKGNLPYVMGLDRQLQSQLVLNEAAQARNTQTAAEVADLKEGLEMVEEKARAELGMLRPDEILVQVTQRPVAAYGQARSTATPAVPSAAPASR
jgi:cell division protein FtsB